MPVIIDDGGIVDDGGVALYAYTIIINAWRSNILPVNKTPVIGRWRITTERKVYVYAELRAQWRPAVIIATASPANPGRRPFITRDP
jgi:hypothetical protein